MRRMIIAVLLLSAILPLTAEGLPTDAQIADIYTSQPAVIYEMIRKLYSIEHSPLMLIMPTLTVYVADDGSAKILPDTDLKISIGADPYTMNYAQKLEFTVVKVAVKQDTIPWGWITAGAGVLGFVGGVLLGAFGLR